MNATEKTYSWDFLKTFKIEAARPVHGWQAVASLIERSKQAFLPRIQQYLESESQWENRLRPLCGNQYTCDWSKFRPLRRTREEDWSDWLAWLLETSQTGILADSLFAQHMECQIGAFISPKVDREVSVDDRRADIVATWNTDQKSHIEVKIWDENFAKTFETAKKLRKTAPGSDWNDFILIPSESEEAWNEVAQTYDNFETIKVMAILWEDIVRGLRKCLWNEHESIFWRAWAWTFCSMIEKEILGLERLDRNPKKSNPLQMQMTLRWLNVLNPDMETKYE